LNISQLRRTFIGMTVASLACMLVSGCTKNNDSKSVSYGTRIALPQALERVAPENLILSVTVNQERTFVSTDGMQADGNWHIVIDINPGENNAILVSWTTLYDDQEILLAEQAEILFINPGDQSGTITTPLITADDHRFDVDKDGTTNLQEINVGTNPVRPVAGYIVPDMIDIAGGCVEMGSPADEIDRRDDEALHTVCLESYRIGKYEVTYAEYELRVRDLDFQIPAPSAPWGKALQPVGSINWIQATAYAAWLAEKTGRKFRLPTEAEWEHAARSGRSTAFNTGDHITTEAANFDGRIPYGSLSTGDVFLEQTLVTGHFPANGFGLHETHGNVGEWTCSQYQKNYAGAELVCNEDEANTVVWRGGPWWTDASGIRLASRSAAETSVFGNGLGFRLAEDL